MDGSSVPVLASTLWCIRRFKAMLGRLPQELGIAAAALHSHQPQRRRLAALDRCALWHCGRV